MPVIAVGSTVLVQRVPPVLAFSNPISRVLLICVLVNVPVKTQVHEGVPWTVLPAGTRVFSLTNAVSVNAAGVLPVPSAMWLIGFGVLFPTLVMSKVRPLLVIRFSVVHSFRTIILPVFQS